MFQTALLFALATVHAQEAEEAPESTDATETESTDTEEAPETESAPEEGKGTDDAAEAAPEAALEPLDTSRDGYTLTLPRHQFMTGLEIVAGVWTVGSYALLLGSSYKLNKAFEDGGTIGEFAAGGLGVILGYGSYIASSWFWVWKANKHAKKLRYSGLAVNRLPVLGMIGGGALALGFYIGALSAKSANTSLFLSRAMLGSMALVPAFGTVQFVQNMKAGRILQGRELAVLPMIYEDRPGLMLAMTF